MKWNYNGWGIKFVGVAITCGISTAAMASSDPEEVFAIESVVRRHHVYKYVWTPFEGEKLVLEWEHHNSYDRYATTVIKDDVIVGRVPRELSRLFWNFLASGG